MNDTEALNDEHLPNLIDLDTVYYYSFVNENDDSNYLGFIKTVDSFIENVKIESISPNEHEIYLDIGKKKYEFIAPTKFMA